MSRKYRYGTQYFACEKGTEVFIRELLRQRAGPNVQAKDLSVMLSGETSLNLGVMHEHEACVWLLLDYKVCFELK